jgi:predicted glycoside hydrolase/deacetylase ChbG (UPF0249 family)
MMFWRLGLLTLAVLAPLFAQTYAERLGWKVGDRVLILHVDDAGMSHDSDMGVELALEKGLPKSFSVMMPCPWVPEIVAYIRNHPGIDAGLHLTLTSEWETYRWGPLAGRQAVPGLVDSDGALWRTVGDVTSNATADQIETEIRAQLDRARRMAFEPTHMDSHMGTLFASAAYLERYIRVGIENHIPIMFPGGHNTLISEELRDEAIQNLKKVGKWHDGQTLPPDPRLAAARKTGEQIWNAGLPVLDDLHNESYGWTPPSVESATDDELKAFKIEHYAKAFHDLQPGVTMMIMHCTKVSNGFRFISLSGPTREGDLLAMTSSELRAELEREKIIITTWRELAERRRRAR